MILFTKAELKEIFELGKSYSWKKPEYCSVCKIEHLHGYGFATAYFDSYEYFLFIHRYQLLKQNSVGFQKNQLFKAPINTKIF